MNLILKVIELVSFLDDFPLNFIAFLLLLLQLVLLTGVPVFKVDLLLLFSFDILFKSHLLNSPLFKLTFGFQQVLLLLQGLLHGLRPMQQLLLHVLDFLQELLLLTLLLVGFLFFVLQFLKKSILLLFGHLGLLLDL